MNKVIELKLRENIMTRFKEEINPTDISDEDMSIIESVIDSLGKRISYHLSDNKVYTEEDILWAINTVLDKHISEYAINLVNIVGDRLESGLDLFTQNCDSWCIKASTEVYINLSKRG